MWLTAPRPALYPLQLQGQRRSTTTTSHACQRAAPPRALLSFLDTTHPKIETIGTGEQLSRIVDPSVNIVWWPRHLDADTQRMLPSALKHAGIFKHHVVVDAHTAAQSVMSLFPEGPLRTLLAADASDIVCLYLHALGPYPPQCTGQSCFVISPP